MACTMLAPSGWRQLICQPETQGRRDLAKGRGAPALPVPCVVGQASWHWGKRLEFQSSTRFIDSNMDIKPLRIKLAFPAAPLSESTRVLHHGRQCALDFGVFLTLVYLCRTGQFGVEPLAASLLLQLLIGSMTLELTPC